MRIVVSTVVWHRSSLVASASLITVAGIWGVVGKAQDLGDNVPSAFRLRLLAAVRSSLDGEYRDALRQTTKVLNDLGENNLGVKGKLQINHSYVKSMCQALKAQILADLGAAALASRYCKNARDTLTNQKALLRKKRLDSTILNDELAVVELIEAGVLRPAMDFSLGEFDQTKNLAADPFRWKQSLGSCGKQLAAAGITEGRYAGRYLVELARATMHKPTRPGAELDEDRYRDAGLFLGEAKMAFMKDPVWEKVVDPENPVAFKMVDDLKALGAAIKLEDEVAVKAVIAQVLRDWIEWRLAQAELQARQENTDPELGWDFDSAATQFDEMCNFLRVQFKGDDHPAIYRVRLSQARWFVFCGLRAIDELDAGVENKHERNDGEDLDRAKKLAKARSYVKDALRTLKDMVATKRVPPLLEEQCALAELSALTLQIKLDRLENKLADDVRAEIDKRIASLSAQLQSDEFRQRADDLAQEFENKEGSNRD